MRFVFGRSLTSRHANRLNLARTQHTLALASMTAIDAAVELDAHAHSKRPQGITKVPLVLLHD